MSIECDNTTPLGSKNAPELLSENSTALIDAILDLTDVANAGVTNDANGTSIDEFANPLVTIALSRVLQELLTKASFTSLGIGNPPQHKPEYVAMLQQENSYLDSLLDHCTEIDINKKQKKEDETVGAHTAVPGLTNISPQMNTTSSTNAWDLPMNMDIDDKEPAARRRGLRSRSTRRRPGGTCRPS